MLETRNLAAPLILLAFGACSVGTGDAPGTSEQPITNAPGMDVSEFQGAIDWAQVKAGGTQFAFIRIGGIGTSGNSFADKTFATNWPQARMAGVIRGPTFYFQGAYDGVAQGNALVNQIIAAGGLQPGDLPPAIDVEVNLGNTVWDPVTANNVTHLQQLLTTAQNALGVKPYIYTNLATWTFLGNPTQFSVYPLWVANPGNPPPPQPAMPAGGWPTWTFWQYHVQPAPITGMPEAGGLDQDYYTGSCDNGVSVGGTACQSQGASVQYRCLFGSTPGASLWSVESCNGGTCQGSSCTTASSCPYGSVQSRVQKNVAQAWSQSITITLGESFTVGAFHDGSGQLVGCCTTIAVTGPNGFSASPANLGVITPAAAGIYNVTVTCGARSEVSTVTVQGGSSPCTASVPSGSWTGRYWNNLSFSGTPVLTRNDGAGALNFDWGSGSPGTSCGVSVDNFTARWTRTASFSAGTYRFTTTTDDGVRLYVDSVLRIDHWIDQGPTTYTADVTLGAGNHNLQMDYYERGGGAVAKLSWSAVASSPFCSASCAGGGWWCANDGGCIINGLPGHNYHCPGNNVAPDRDQACANGCVIAPAGSPDYCRATTFCGGGAWCGNDCVNGFPSTLYNFNSAGAVTSVTQCQVGFPSQTCTIAPAGSPDHCN